MPWREEWSTSLASDVIDDKAMLLIGGRAPAGVAKIRAQRRGAKDLVVVADTPSRGGKVAEPVPFVELRPRLRDARRVIVEYGRRRVVVVDLFASRPPNPKAGPGQLFLLPAGTF